MSTRIHQPRLHTSHHGKSIHWMRYSALALTAVLAACGTSQQPATYAPVITVSPSTGTATETPSTAVAPAGDPFAQLASRIGKTYGDDDTAFINLAGGMPSADPVGFACASDLANVSNGLKTQPNTNPLGQPGVLSSLEALRLQLMQFSAAGGNPLLMQTLSDCDTWAMSSVKMGLALKPELLTLLNQIQTATITSGGATPLMPSIGPANLP
jgi:hypothetical protein